MFDGNCGEEIFCVTSAFLSLMSVMKIIVKIFSKTSTIVVRASLPSANNTATSKLIRSKKAIFHSLTKKRETT